MYERKINFFRSQLAKIERQLNEGAISNHDYNLRKRSNLGWLQYFESQQLKWERAEKR